MVVALLIFVSGVVIVRVPAQGPFARLLTPLAGKANLALDHWRSKGGRVS